METTPAVTLFLILGIIIGAARMAGALARTFNQPRVLGELIIGVILGPTLINLLHMSFLNVDQAELQETVINLAELGVLLLMFKVGLEVNLQELLNVGLVATLAGICGALVPIILVTPLIIAFGHSWQEGLFVGVALSATSVSISAQTLIELKLLNTKVGNALLAAAVVDDIVAILLVSLIVPIIGSTGSPDMGELAVIFLKMTGYIVIAFTIAWFTLPRIFEWFHNHAEGGQSYSIPALALIMALLFGWAATYFGGVAAITGAFIAGLGLGQLRQSIKHQIETPINDIAYTFLVPVFFVSVGLQTNLRGFPLSAVPLAALLMVIAVVSKVFGCGFGAIVGRFNRLEAFQLGVCMISRGEVGLIIAALGISIGIFQPDSPVFASLFLVIILTTVVTPPMVRRAFNLVPTVRIEENHAKTHRPHHTTN